ncbi:Mu transposase domain-containing protein [Rhodococcus tibetensis]|uniref:Mu transposase domain-containing protein n=1 Tax=Rhodococcus tibetensis TaxID=2965064 RepID=UPI0035ABEF40
MVRPEHRRGFWDGEGAIGRWCHRKFGLTQDCQVAVVTPRRKRVRGCARADRIDADRHAMLALPPVPPVTGRRSSTQLARDHFLKLDSNDYSVHPSVSGVCIENAASLARVPVRCEGALIADYHWAWAKHQDHRRSRVCQSCCGTAHDRECQSCGSRSHRGTESSSLVP